MRFRGNLPDILMLVSFFFFSTWSWTISSLIMRNQERLAKPANYLPGSKRLTVQWETVSSQIAKYLTFPGPTAIFKLIALKETFFKKIPHLHSILWEQGTMTKNITNPQQYVLFITGKLSKSHASMHNVYFA